MKNITKKILILTGLLIFNCNTNFCMQNVVKTIKGPNGRWKVRVYKDKAQILNKSLEKLKEFDLAKEKNTENLIKWNNKRKGHPANMIKFSPNGKYIAVLTHHFRQLVVINPETNKQNTLPPMKNYQIIAFKFSPNSQKIAYLCKPEPNANYNNNNRRTHISHQKKKTPNYIAISKLNTNNFYVYPFIIFYSPSPITKISFNEPNCKYAVVESTTLLNIFDTISTKKIYESKINGNKSSFLTSSEILKFKNDDETEIVNLKKEKINNKNIGLRDIILKVDCEDDQKPQFILIKSKSKVIKVNKKRIRKQLIDAAVVCHIW